MRIGGLSYQSGTENRYRYNGKEFHQELNLGLYDYGFRWYNPAIARFVSVDPLAEDFPHNAVYAYAENRPIDGIDLEGFEYLSYLEKFEYQGGLSNIVTAVDNAAISVINEGIGLWNSAVATVEIIANEGLSGYGEALSNDVEAIAEGVTEEVSEVVEYISETPADQMVEDLGNELNNPQNLENAISTAASLLISKKPGRPNKLKPDPEAKGDHTSFQRDENGNIYKYETYEITRTGHPNPVKRFDGGKRDGSAGRSHTNKKTKQDVPTPHVQGKTIPGGVRPPSSNEVPNNKRFNNGKK